MRNTEVEPAAEATGSDPAARAARVAELERRSGSADRLFDVRTVVGGLFVCYGLIIGFAGVFASPADLRKAQGVNINLWTGLAMLLVGVLFLLWMRFRPLTPPHAESAADGDPAPDTGDPAPDTDGPAAR
jgi:hypothetical protein